MESPSGRACEEIRKRLRARIASRISAISVFSRLIRAVDIIWRGRRPGVRLGLQFLEDLLDAILVGDGLVEEELELGHAAKPDPLGDLAAQEGEGAPERLLGLAQR